MLGIYCFMINCWYVILEGREKKEYFYLFICYIVVEEKDCMNGGRLWK